MTPQQIVEKSIEISNMFDGIATKVFEKAKLLRKTGEITHMEYIQIMNNYYLPLMNYSSRILMDASNVLIADIDKYMITLENSTDKLKEVSERIMKAEQIFKAVTFVLASAAAVAFFASAPSPATFKAAASSISGAIENISAIINKGEE